MARGERGKGVDQDAPKQDAPAAKEVRQVTSEQAESATNYSREVEKQSDPKIELWIPRLEIPQYSQCGTQNNRQDNEFIEIECKAEGGDSADEPLDRCQAG